MSRDPKKVFSKTFNTRSRKDYIDADFLDQLTPEELEWYAKFTDEYYGASFEINPAWAKKEEVLEILEKELILATKEKKCNACKVKFTGKICPECLTNDWNYKKKKLVSKIEHNIERVNACKTKKVQISGHSEPKNNIDLRKCRSIDLYYRGDKGYLTKNPEFKYSKNNVHGEDYLEDCNRRVNSNNRDLMCKGSKNEPEADVNQYVEMWQSGGLSCEDYLIANHEINQRYEFEDEIDEDVIDLRED